MEFIDFLDSELEHTHKSDNPNVKFKIKDIFADHWDSFVSDNPELNIRPVVFHEVNRMMSCGSLSNGYSVYTCDNCNNYLYVPFTCKSRFCSSCGVNYSLDRAETIVKKCIKCNHRHITFTVSDILWPLFQKDRSLLNLLFLAVEKTLLSWFYELNKSEHFIPGFISTLHTFGRDLKWNTHIHTLITEGACGNFTVWRKIAFFPFQMLRRRFQTTLLHLLEDAIGKSAFRPFRNAIFSNYSKGFYVYAPKLYNRDVKSTVKYVIRYTGRPAMAESRIINYDGEFVTFYYERHEDGQRVEETIHAYDFIKRLIVHIPDKYFNMIRYYGLYAKKHKFADKLFYMLSPVVAKIRKQISDWNHRILLYFKHEPLLCSCGHHFHFDYIVEKQYNSS